MALHFGYKQVKRPGPLSSIKAPHIEVKLSGPKETLSVVALVDSGADTSAIPEGIAEILGLTKGKEDFVIGVGGKIKAYDSKLTVTVEGTHEKHVIPDVPVKVIPDTAGNGLPVILGRLGFFQYFEVTFREKAQQIILKKSINR